MRLYESLCKIFIEVSNLDNIMNLLDWDAQVVMPPNAIEDRIKQVNTISGIKHDILTSNTVLNLIQELSKQKFKLNQWQSSNLLHMERLHNTAKVIPLDLSRALNKACIASRNIWKQAKQENKFSMWLPHLEEVINLSIQVATAKAEYLNCSRYEALLDTYEPELKTSQLNSIFSNLGKFLREFIPIALEQQPSISAFEANFSLKKQRDLSQEIIKILKISNEQIRIDESIHPFSVSTPFDARITVQYDEKDFVKGLKATLHECGHALYGTNLPIEYYGQPVGQAMGTVMHEAQALIFEKQIGSSTEFISHITPLLKKIFKVKGLTVKNIYNMINYVNPSAIRIHADEVTYPVHIMSRYGIEKSLIDDDLQAKDLPQAWNEDMQYYLGITPNNDTEGCMQDIHWASGLFGYFPSYLLGSIASAQIFSKIKEDTTGVKKKMSNGNLEPIIKWLTENIYKQGNRYNSQELLKQVTDSELNEQSYIDYLQTKYLNNTEDPS